MIRIKPAVIETEDNFHMVYIGREYNPVFIGIAGGDTETDLCDVLEYVYGDCDFDYECCGECDGWRIYDVEVDDDVE